jgi:hypothetical protein
MKLETGCASRLETGCASRLGLVEIAKANLRYMNEDQAAEWVAELMAVVLGGEIPTHDSDN